MACLSYIVRCGVRADGQRPSDPRCQPRRSSDRKDHMPRLVSRGPVSLYSASYN